MTTACRARPVHRSSRIALAPSSGSRAPARLSESSVRRCSPVTSCSRCTAAALGPSEQLTSKWTQCPRSHMHAVSDTYKTHCDAPSHLISSVLINSHRFSSALNSQVRRRVWYADEGLTAVRPQDAPAWMHGCTSMEVSAWRAAHPGSFGCTSMEVLAWRAAHPGSCGYLSGRKGQGWKEKWQEGTRVEGKGRQEGTRAAGRVA